MNSRTGTRISARMKVFWIAKNVLVAIMFVWLSVKVWYTVSDIASGTIDTVSRVPMADLMVDTPPKHERAETQSYTMTSLSSDLSANKDKTDNTEEVGVIETHSVYNDDTNNMVEVGDKEAQSVPASHVDEEESEIIGAGVIETLTEEPLSGLANNELTNQSPSTNFTVTSTSKKSHQNEYHTIEPVKMGTSTTKTESVTQSSRVSPTLNAAKEQDQTVKTRQEVTKASASNDESKTVTVSTIKHDNETEARHVMFLKVHKCGSSTVQNIFLRFGYFRNLSFVLGHDNISIAETAYVNVISYKQSLTERNVVPPPHGRHFDILCCHVIYNREQFQKFLPRDTVNIGIVREPVKRLESSIGYFKLFKDVAFSDFASEPLKYDSRFPSMANNRMGFEYGFPKECFPPVSSSGKFEVIKQQISDHLKQLDKDFSFIIINERMDESLVYMKRLLRWHMRDILYATLLSSKKDRRKFTEQETTKLRDYLYLDYALYDFAVKRFEAAIAKESDDFQDEVKQFKKTNHVVGVFCSSKDTEALPIEASPWNNKFFVTKKDCELFTIYEMTFVQRIRLQQYGTLNN